MTALYPWHQTQWQRLQTAWQQGRLPHALLLSGAPGLGKHRFAQHLAQAALCEQPDPQGLACDQCSACHLFTHNTHPDFHAVAPQEKSHHIKVDQIRQLIDFMVLSRHHDRHKVVIINPAEAMNVNSANSLLKTLEEPAAYSLMILISSQPNRLPATIRSRCQLIPFAVPTQVVAQQWLQEQGVSSEHEALLRLAHGAPLKAVQLAQEQALESRQSWRKQLLSLMRGTLDAPALAITWADIDPQTLLDWLQGRLYAMTRWRLAAAPDELLGDSLKKAAEDIDLNRLFELQDKMIQYRRMLSGSLNAQLLLEDILLSWAQAFELKSTTA